jgi:hypothetical protein
VSANAKLGEGDSTPAAPSQAVVQENGRASSRRKGSSARHTSLAARGEPYVWLTGAGLGVAVLMIVGLLSMVLVRGTTTFWPKPILELTLVSGEKVLGEVTRSESFLVGEQQLADLPEATRQAIAKNEGYAHRRLIRTGNYDLYGDDFKWVPDYTVVSERTPRDAWLLERREWGPAFGFPEQRCTSGRTRTSIKFAATRSTTLGNSIASWKQPGWKSSGCSCNTAKARSRSIRRWPRRPASRREFNPSSNAFAA